MYQLKLHLVQLFTFIKYRSNFLVLQPLINHVNSNFRTWFRIEVNEGKGNFTLQANLMFFAGEQICVRKFVQKNIKNNFL